MTQQDSYIHVRQLVFPDMFGVHWRLFSNGNIGLDMWHYYVVDYRIMWINCT